MYIINAFSFNMINGFPCTVNAKEISLDEACYLANEGNIISGVGHASTAAVFSTLLGINIPCDRRNISLNSEDVALGGEYYGPRLEEGATELPQGATIKWLLVDFNENQIKELEVLALRKLHEDEMKYATNLQEELNKAFSILKETKAQVASYHEALKSAQAQANSYHTRALQAENERDANLQAWRLIRKDKKNLLRALKGITRAFK